MEQARQAEDLVAAEVWAEVKAEVEWAAHSPQARAEIAFVRTVAIRLRTSPGSPAISRLAQNAGQQWPENNPNEEGGLRCQAEIELARWEWAQ